ncbi:histone-like nucleoid-structuring protein Lsr2 [Streptomyces sp. NPDC018029]|uniref:Lsr2 family DNA-binding protein n=1 Tax=Streptomyces sp. NPDC018029 TaxID=3365032 RepID=UPI0037898AD9
MRKTVLVPVEKTYCDAHLSKSGAEVEAAEALVLGTGRWDLCLEHSVIFGRYLCDALGVPGVDEPAPVEPQPDLSPVPEPAPAPVAEPEARDVSEDVADADVPESAPSVMLAGEVPGYEWDAAREAVRNLGYEVVGRADASTVLLILGEGGERNGTKLRDAAERGIPCMDVRAPGRFRDAIRAGELSGGDPLPEPAKVGPKTMTERERNKVMRAWAREHGYTVPVRGRIPMNVRHAYELAHKDAAGKAVAA